MITTIGLEVHAQLNTQTKIFCGCAVRFGSEPNSLVCPVCLGLPGVLPVLNRRVFSLGLRAVLAFGGTPSQKIKFDRKNYFYPDLPKGYQISQYDCPLGQGGFVELETQGKIKKVRLNRIHLEEDAGKLIHDAAAGSSQVDLNRAGTPLIEIVSEPDLETPEESYEFLTVLKSVLKTIAVSECDMEKGHLRCDANVSVRKNATDPLGKKVEIKNLNSFKAVRAALSYEIIRQTERVEKNEPVAQETRLWDDSRQKTFSMRSKEEAHDYRYFPEPDLVPFFVTEDEVTRERDALPELPRQKRERFMRQYQLSEYDAGLLASQKDISDFYENALKVSGAAPKVVTNWIIGPIFGYLADQGIALEETKLSADLFAGLLRLVEQGKVSFQAAKDKIFPEVIGKGRDAAEIMKEMGLEQVSDESALEKWIIEAVRANPGVVEDFKSGKETAAMFFVGQVMKKSQGKANPGRVQELVRKKLKEL
jgi:aspartyl-tRNA(Asn)/glutamyl-tRNA(Gln) amidotransferase subunit B